MYALAVIPQMRQCFRSRLGLSENVGCANAEESGHQELRFADRRTTTGALQNDSPARLTRYRNLKNLDY